MKLSEYLEPSVAEKIFCEKILESFADADLSEEKISALFGMLVLEDVGSLLKLAIATPRIDKLLSLPVFQAYWNLCWQKSGPQTPSLLTYETMSTISSLELLKGIYIYEGYRKLIQDMPSDAPDLLLQAEEYLSRAGDFGCYYAINVLCTEGLKTTLQIEDVETKQNKVQKILHYAKKAADVYLTPGYLLLSSVYHELTAQSGTIFEDNGCTEKYYFFQAILALQLAHKLEPYSFPMIHNAYQGQTINEVSDNKIKSWFQFKTRLQTLSKGLLTIIDVNKAADLAVTTVPVILARSGIDTAIEEKVEIAAKYKP
jgi:hypothetical protein